MKSKNKYVIPIDRKYSKFSIKRNLLWIIEQLTAGTHNGDLKYAIDFILPEGSPIYAAESGKIIWIRKDSNVGGPFKKYWLKGNRIVIQHKNKEYSAYEHLKYKGVLVKIGQIVKKGQLIGYSGNTGYSFIPHLHFEVFKNIAKDKSEGITIEPRFRV